MVSQIAQASIVVTIFTWFLVIKNRVSDYLVLMAISCLFYFQGEYFLNLAVVYIAYVLGRDVNKKTVYHLFLLFSFTVAILSLINFYLFGVSVYYSHYFLPISYRLIGLDASPTLVAFSSGLAILLLLENNDLKRVLRLFLILFFLIVLLLTASRTAILGVLLGMGVAFFRQGLFSLYILLLMLSPLIFSWLYIFYHDDLINMFIEAATSNRVVNWVNLVNFFFDKPVVYWLFGIGKPPIIDDPLVLKAVSDLYTYKFVTYAESSWLKILTYHGIFVFVISILYFVKKSYRLIDYRSKVIFFYIVFGGVFYDSVLSVQYALILVLLFSTLEKCSHHYNR
ncbi:MAG: O-antigen ligase family protein [Campylobacterales bacterium]|nr:O-antigen ligase family protein [Campylobacterales bacterium]